MEKFFVAFGLMLTLSASFAGESKNLSYDSDQDYDHVVLEQREVDSALVKEINDELNSEFQIGSSVAMYCVQLNRIKAEDATYFQAYMVNYIEKTKNSSVYARSYIMNNNQICFTAEKK